MIHMKEKIIVTGISHGCNYTKELKGEQVSSREKQKLNRRNKSELKAHFSKAERLAFLDRERAELPKELQKQDYELSDETVKEIRELGKEKQPKGFWANYAKTHGYINESYLYNVRSGRARKDVK